MVVATPTSDNLFYHEKLKKKMNFPNYKKCAIFCIVIAFVTSTVFSQTPVPKVFNLPQSTTTPDVVAKSTQLPTYTQTTSNNVNLHPKTLTTIKELQELAIQNHPVYKLSENLVEAERGARTQASLRPNPSVSYSADDIEMGGAAGKYGVAIEQAFGGAKKRSLLVQQSDRTIDMLNWNKHISIAKIRNDVRSLAYQVLIAQKKIEFQRQLLSIYQEAEKNAQVAIFSGSVEISQLDFIQIQNQTRQAQLTLTQEINSKEALEKQLAILVGVDKESLGELVDNPETLSDEETLDENASLNNILERSPEIAKKRAEINQKQALLAYERSPQREFSVSGGVSYDFADKSTLAQIGVGIPLRINDVNQGNIQKATAEYFAAQQELERLQLKLRTDFADIFAAYKSAKAEVQTYRSAIIPDVEKLYKMSQQAYQQGQINDLDLSSARATYIEASISYLEALKRLADSLVKIEGQLLEQSLEGID